MSATSDSRTNRTDRLEQLVDGAALDALLAHNEAPLDHFKQALETANTTLAEHFLRSEPIATLVRTRSQVVDTVICTCWKYYAAAIADHTDLVAVGGYGRGDLLPHSDIDLLILLNEPGDAEAKELASRFLTFLWDIGLEVGHSVRTLDDCEREAAKDITVLTTLMEARLLTGPGTLFSDLPQRISTHRMWDSASFFKAKVTEQEARHHHFDDTAYNLEPNVKGGPGGLRDIQTIGWVARRHLGTHQLEDLVEHGFLTDVQLQILITGQAVLWRIRFALHLLTDRREDRLLFDYQIQLAKMLGYEDASHTLAVEQLMQHYYRTVMELSRLNEMLLQLFEEAIVVDRDAAAIPLNAHFRIRNDYLEATDSDVFANEPSALLEIFLLLGQNLDLKGISARTIALIKQHTHLIDENFRRDPHNHRLFLDILRAPDGVTRALKRMNTYGVLGLYLPAFGRIVGRMQYDLFHAYTVDAHTLFVVENLRRFALSRFNHEFPNCSAVMQQLGKPEIVYLAGLFHDIAKGRGGDHSELGAADAETFCLEHGLRRYDARLVAWLVRHHLDLSMTAQKKDLTDPVVINEFARMMGDEAHLDYLYVLTVADVRGTNPKMWNSWKDTLFWELHQATKRALRRGISNPLEQDELILETQTEAEQLLDEQGFEAKHWQPIWKNFTEEYFLRHRPEEIAWHTRVLMTAAPSTAVLVDINEDLSEGVTAVMVSAPHVMRSFKHVTAVLDELGLTIVDARIVPMTAEQNLDTYFILESDGSPISGERRFTEIQNRLLNILPKEGTEPLTVTRRAPRRVRMFSTPVSVDIANDPINQRTVIELVAGDRPGLLLKVARVLEEENILLQNAKISTVGERAEDVFFITSDKNLPLDDSDAERLKARLHAAAEEQDPS